MLNAEALQPLWRLFAALALVGVTYYWSQVYTRTLATMLNTLLHGHGIGNDEFGFDSESPIPPDSDKYVARVGVLTTCKRALRFQLSPCSS